MDLIVTTRGEEVVRGRLTRRRMMVMVMATMLSTMSGTRVEAAATCSYLPDTSQLSCRWILTFL